MNRQDPSLNTDPLAGHAAVAELLFRYAHGVRNGDVAACAALFTEDATFEVRDAAPGDPKGYRVRQILKGRTDIQAYLQHGSIASVRVCPLIHNPIIALTGLEAASTCMMTAWVLPSGRQILGEYHDRCRFEGAWRFSSRVYTILGHIDPPAAAAAPVKGQ